MTEIKTRSCDGTMSCFIDDVHLPRLLVPNVVDISLAAGFRSRHINCGKKYTSIHTVSDLISEHTLISRHPPIFVFYINNYLVTFVKAIQIYYNYTGLMVTMVKTTARAHRDVCVLAVLLCCIMLLCSSIFNR